MSVRLPNDLQFFLQAYHQRPVHHTLYFNSIRALTLSWYDIRCYNYKDGQKHGLSEYWNDQGQLILRCNYKDGQWHGLGEEWNDQGQLKGRGNWKDGQRHGLCEEWNDQGGLIWSHNYKDGQLHGVGALNLQ